MSNHKRAKTQRQQFVSIPDGDINAPRVKCYSVEEYRAMLEAESQHYADDWHAENKVYFDKLRGE